MKYIALAILVLLTGACAENITTDYYCPYKTEGNQKWSNRVWWDLKSTIYGKIPSVISNLYNEMKIPIESEEDNW